MIAATHPGKHGDAIYALPTLKALAERFQTTVDFYTSDYCEPLRTLFEYQPFVGHFYVAPNYVVERMDMGVQPSYVPVDNRCYDKVYQLGYRGIPDRPLPDYIAHSVGLIAGPVSYAVPDHLDYWDQFNLTDYIVLAPRGETSYKELFRQLIDRSPVPVVLVGGDTDEKPFWQHDNVESMTGSDYLDTAYVISKARAFIGLSSSQLCLANGFPIPRICPHDGIHWDERHWVRSEFNHYPVNPSVEDLLALIPEKRSP